jgi:hypothetical protein
MYKLCSHSELIIVGESMDSRNSSNCTPRMKLCCELDPNTLPIAHHGWRWWRVLDIWKWNAMQIHIFYDVERCGESPSTVCCRWLIFSSQECQCTTSVTQVRESRLEMDWIYSMVCLMCDGGGRDCDDDDASAVYLPPLETLMLGTKSFPVTPYKASRI